MQLYVNRNGEVFDAEDFEPIDLPSDVAQAIIDEDFETLRDAVISHFG